MGELYLYLCEVFTSVCSGTKIQKSSPRNTRVTVENKVTRFMAHRVHLRKTRLNLYSLTSKSRTTHKRALTSGPSCCHSFYCPSETQFRSQTGLFHGWHKVNLARTSTLHLNFRLARFAHPMISATLFYVSVDFLCSISVSMISLGPFINCCPRLCFCNIWTNAISLRTTCIVYAI